MEDDSDAKKEPIVEHSEVNNVNMETVPTEEEIGGLEASGNTPKRVPCQFFLDGRCRFGDRCRNLHTGLPEPSTSLHPSKTSAIRKEKIASEPKTEKKPPMKTATDVISRIQWDSLLPTDHFSVGYLDRFLGIIEKPFAEFSWEDLASVGHDVLAIPKHRIQYFKYKRLVVWDKTTRVDNVFGSTGSGTTILDIINQYENMECEEQNVDPQEDHDDLVREDENVDNECLPSADDCRNAKKLRPTHFIAVRISEEEVRSSVNVVQEALKKWNPDIAEFCTSLPVLHLTLCLLHLETPEEIQKSLTIIQEWRQEIQRILPPSLILSFEGLKDFNARVLYLAPSSTPELTNFTHTLNERFCSEGLTVIKAPSNHLHVTVAKVPTNILRKNPRLRFFYDVYGHIPVSHFGAQHVDSISFCENGPSRRTDGFYTTLLEFPLY
uniref:C3H1-type domain-containing protein n=1 Tax=Leptobrachium leishanense TaxID=445787 RepID=A0A8C5QMD3_9ANUR